MNDRPLRQLRKRYALLWLGPVFFGIIAIIGIVEIDWFMMLGGGAMTIGAISTMGRVRRHIKATDLYRPGRGFWFYRLNQLQKLRYLSTHQGLVILLVLLTYWAGAFSWYATLIAIGVEWHIQFMIKPRIKLHTPVDDVSRFELEEMGFIQTGDIVVGIYKDFENWHDSVDRGTVAVLLYDRLLVLHFSPAADDEGDEGIVFSTIDLRQINRLYCTQFGRQGNGLIVSIGLTDDSILRFAVSGNSTKDSPEQFVQQMLETIDKQYF